MKIEDTEQLGDNPTLELFQGPKLLFGCNLEKGEVKIVEKTENKELIQRYKISGLIVDAFALDSRQTLFAGMFEGRSFMKKPTVLCAIQARKAHQLVNK